MSLRKSSSNLLLVSFLGLCGGLFPLSVSASVIVEGKESLPQCPINNAVETGRIQNGELREASGLVASHRHPGVYYSIQDSLSPSNVYAVNYNGVDLGSKHPKI